MQHPVEIPGLKFVDLLRSEISTEERVNTIQLYRILNDKMRHLKMNPELLNRSINEQFSGGEKKKSEILQWEVLDREVILLDEIDSGLDTDALQVISEVLTAKQKTIIYISHNDRLSTVLIPTKVLVIFNGEIVKTGGYELAQKIQAEGSG